MTPVCEVHDEVLAHLKDTLVELKRGAEDRKKLIDDLEKRKVSLKIFGWILGVLVSIWLGIQGVVWSELKVSRAEIIDKIETSDKMDMEKRGETWRRLDDLKSQVNRLEWRMDKIEGNGKIKSK